MSKHGECFDIYCCIQSSHREDEFQLAFARIGELRSIIPENIGVMVFTATVTNNMLKVIKERLSLRELALIGLPSSQRNITLQNRETT